MAAIYMWIEDQEVIVTTTLYPIEVIDGVDFGISMVSGSMAPVPNESLDVTAPSVLSVYMEVVLNELPIADEALDVSAVDIVDVYMEMVLFALPVQDEALDVTAVAVLDVTMESLLVTGLMPDEGIDFAISLVSGSMTPA